MNVNKVIYVMENKINHKKYIGQTNNFHLRMNGHRSDANNPNSRSYKYPLSNAIRKYGWKNFNNYIIEELPEEADYKLVDEREKFFIQHFQSLTTQNGYNICVGGQGNPKEQRTYKEKINMSSLFSAKEIVDIQNMLINGEEYSTILNKYPKKLTSSFLSNINLGYNFKNPEWKYPLHKMKSKKFSKKDQKLIKQDIIDGMKYNEISKKWSISYGMVSLINNGKTWYDDSYEYPLSYRKNSRLHNANTWVRKVQQDILNTKLTLVEIAKKYNKSYSTIKKINSGSSHRKNNYKYPLTSNRT